MASTESVRAEDIRIGDVVRTMEGPFTVAAAPIVGNYIRFTLRRGFVELTRFTGRTAVLSRELRPQHTTPSAFTCSCPECADVRAEVAKVNAMHRAATAWGVRDGSMRS